LCDILETLAAGESGELTEDFETPDPSELAAAAIGGVLRKWRRPDPAPHGNAAKMLALEKLAGEILPRLDALQDRVEQIARTPLPPQTIARGIAIGKREDGGFGLSNGDDVAAALARMSEEERTLTLIKAAHASPIDPFARPR
jgi:hypothetical protein